MQSLIDAIGLVTGPLTLVAFLAVISLFLYRRSVHDKRGLEFAYRLFKINQDKEEFYLLANKVVTYAYRAILFIFALSLAAYVVVKFIDANSTANAKTGKAPSEPYLTTRAVALFDFRDPSDKTMSRRDYVVRRAQTPQQYTIRDGSSGTGLDIEKVSHPSATIADVEPAIVRLTSPIMKVIRIASSRFPLGETVVVENRFRYPNTIKPDSTTVWGGIRLMHPTTEIVLVAQFPESRPCKEAALRYGKGSEELKVVEAVVPMIANGGTLVTQTFAHADAGDGIALHCKW